VHTLCSDGDQQNLPEVLRLAMYFWPMLKVRRFDWRGSENQCYCHADAEITPYTMVVKIGGQTEVQVSVNGQRRIVATYVVPNWQPAGVTDVNIQPQISYLEGSTLPIFDDWLRLETTRGIESGKLYQIAQHWLVIAVFITRGLPKRFKTERLPAQYR